MDSKILGGILLIVGTSIGAGMLALPVAVAGGGFISSSLLLILCWAVMTFSAFLMLEVNLWLPPHTNIISMARATLGKSGAAIAWGSYLLLLYSLLAAYISGGSALFYDIASLMGLSSPLWLDAILFVAVFGFIVYKGIKPVDYVNRLLMIAKFGSLFILILCALPYLNHHHLLGGSPLLLTSAMTVTITSFGFANLIPSLRSYFDSDVRKLRLTILLGSLVPLVCYFFWDLAILGTLPREGKDGLLQVLKKGGAGTQLVQSLSEHLHNSAITHFAHLFTVICVLTSFLGVSLGLSDFLADGFKIQKKGKGGGFIFAMTFFPSLAIVLFYPAIFVKALSYAGIFALILIVLLPACMAWSGRYCKPLAVGHYQVSGGRTAILVLVLTGVVIIGIGMAQLTLT